MGERATGRLASAGRLGSVRRAVAAPLERPAELDVAAPEAIRAALAEAIAQGATVATGGRRVDGPGAYYEATVLTDVTPDMRIAQEEIFGPVLCVIPFESDDEAVAIGVQASAGDMTLDVTDNRFVNLARAIELRAYDSTVVGDVTSNVFDFPIVARPQAASFSLVDSDVTLDLTLNRWGEVTSAGALEDLMQFSFEGVSRLELVLGPVGTQP